MYVCKATAESIALMSRQASYLAASKVLQSSEWSEVSMAGVGFSVVGLVCKMAMARRNGDTANIGFSRRILGNKLE